MTEKNEKTPHPEEVEREISDFLTKKYGDRVQVLNPVRPEPDREEPERGVQPGRGGGLRFDLKPEELTAYLDQYIIRQDRAKAVLATKICTHYNRVSRAGEQGEDVFEMVGGVKNNVLLMGPTGVGKTYMLRLIAKRLGVPFVKGDATKFSETGYVGGDVEDLVRDLVREADGDIERAQYGIIYIDEIDKIASPGNVWGADVSRTGVQRALLKPMEETEVDLKVPHDPVSMIQEIERFRRSGKREPSRINTRNILFIMSGAFSELGKIIRKRVQEKSIGFGASVAGQGEENDYLPRVKAEDLIAFGFESEFIGRLPIVAVLEKLTREDLFEILKNPNNPLILNKKLDFAAYGIDIRFTDEALEKTARNAAAEHTGARGLVSALERALLLFEKSLPSTEVKKFTVTGQVVDDPEKVLAEILASPKNPRWTELHRNAARAEREWILVYLSGNRAMVADRFNLKLTPSRRELIADLYTARPTDVRSLLAQVRRDYGRVKKLEVRFYEDQGVNIAFDDDAVDYVIRTQRNAGKDMDAFYDKLTQDFEYGLKLIRERTGKSRFFLPVEALKDPGAYLDDLIRDELTGAIPTDGNAEAAPKG